MGFSVDEFPFTSNYDSDLRAILKYMREFEAKLTSFQELADQLEEDVNETIPDLNDRVEELESNTADLNVIRENLSGAISDLESLTNKEKGDIEAIWNWITEFSKDVESWEEDLTNVYTYVDQRLGVMERNIDLRISKVRLEFNTQLVALEKTVSDLSNRVEYMIRHLAVDVYNPVLNKRMTFDDNNKAVYIDLRDDGMSYGELAARQFTYGFIANAKWRQRLFSTKGRRYVTHSATWLHSPLSGRWTSWAEALSQVLGFVVGSPTYAAFNAKEYTYQDLEDMELTYAGLILLDSSGSPGGGGGSSEPIYMSGALVVDGDGNPLTYGELNRTTVNV